MATEKRNMSRNEHKEPSLESEKGCPITRRKGIQEANKAGSRRRAWKGSPGER